jgi:hypothetical protein
MRWEKSVEMNEKDPSQENHQPHEKDLPQENHQLQENRISLTPEEAGTFCRGWKSGIYQTLHRKKLLTDDQLRMLLGKEQ